jgi:hypothetical protein
LLITGEITVPARRTTTEENSPKTVLTRPLLLPK